MPDIKPISEKEIDELDRYRAVYTLFSKLRASEARADKEGWISADDVENGIKTITAENSPRDAHDVQMKAAKAAAHRRKSFAKRNSMFCRKTADTEYCIKISNTDIIICKVIRKVRDIIWNRIIMKKI